MDVSETCTEKLRQMGCVRRCEHISTPEARCLRWLSAAAQEVSLFYVAEEVYYTYQIRGCRIVLVVEKQFQVMFIGRRTLWLVLSPSLIKGNLLLHCTWTRGRSCLSSEPNPGKALPFPCLWGPCYSGDRVSNAHALRTLSTPHRSLWFILYCVCVCVKEGVFFFWCVFLTPQIRWLWLNGLTSRSSIPFVFSSTIRFLLLDSVVWLEVRYCDALRWSKHSIRGNPRGIEVGEREGEREEGKSCSAEKQHVNKIRWTNGGEQNLLKRSHV